MKEYMRHYYRKTRSERYKPRLCLFCKKEFIPNGLNRIFCSKVCYNKHRQKYIRENIKIKKEEFKAKIETLIGNACIICGSHENLIFHEINGEEHYTTNIWRYYPEIIENHHDFIPICKTHHLAVHQLARTLHSEAELTKATQIIKGLIK